MKYAKRNPRSKTYRAKVSLNGYNGQPYIQIFNIREFVPFTDVSVTVRPLRKRKFDGR